MTIRIARRLVAAGHCIIFLVALMGLPHLVQAISEEEALKDWNGLHESYNALEEKLGDTIPSYKAVIIGTDYDAILALLKDVEGNDVPRIRKQLASFEAKYGGAAEEIDKAMEEAVELDWNSGKHPREQAGRIYENLMKRVDDLDEAKKSKAEELMREAESVQSRIDSFPSQVRDENYAELKEKLELVLKFDPANAEAKERLANVGKQKKEAVAAVEKGIDEAKWPGHYPNFAGPGNPDKLCASAMEWLQKDEASRKQDDPDHTFAVCVRGDWWIAKKNILGEPIQWGLPIYAACYNKEEKQNGICRVFSLTILTQEGAGVEKAPPWTGVTVGDIYKMRIAKVKGATGGKATSGGFSGFAFRILLFLGNAAAGLLLGAPLLKQKISFLGGLEEKLSPLGKQVGIAVLAIAGLSLLRTLVFCGFALFADLLPQAAGILAGLCIVKKPLLEKLAPKIGLACLVLAILHLVLAGLPLV